VLGLGEAGAVAPAQLEVVLQEGREGGEVVGLACLHPRPAGRHAGAGHLGHQLAGDAHGLVEVAPGDADDVGLELVARRRFGEQRADALVGEALVGQAPDGGAHLPARAAAGGRHAHLLVPGHEHADAIEVGDLGQALAQLVHRARLAMSSMGSLTSRGGSPVVRAAPWLLRGAYCRIEGRKVAAVAAVAVSRGTVLPGGRPATSRQDSSVPPRCGAPRGRIQRLL